MSEDVISKIQKLLNKAESTNHEAEADAFFAKAQELMVKHAIDEEALKAAGKQPTEEIQIIEVTIKEGQPATLARQLFLSKVAKAMSCRVLVWPKQNKMTVIGYESEAKFVALLYMSAEMQSRSAVLREIKTAKDEWELRGEVDLGFVGLGPVHPKFRPGVWRRNFIEGYLSRVGDRIIQRYVKVDESHGTGTSIVLRDRGMLVEAWMNNQFTIGGTKQQRRSVQHDFAARAAGAQAGDSADISGGRGHLSGTRKELES